MRDGTHNDLLERVDNMKRRSETEMRIDILKAIAKGKSKITHIIYASNMNYKTAEACMKVFLKRKLVLHEKGRYYITPTGNSVIRAHRRLLELLEAPSKICIFGKAIKNVKNMLKAKNPQ